MSSIQFIVFFISINFSLNLYASEISETCTLNLSWGHGGPGHVAKTIGGLQSKGVIKKGETIAQGCGTPKLVNNSTTTWNKYQVWQTGFNGDWMGELSLLDNGGFNPVMSLKSREVLDKYSGVHDKDKLLSEAVDGKYIEFENEWISYLSKHAKLNPDDLVEGINSVGFMRLTQYHWAALMKRADELIATKACRQVSLNFACHDEHSDFDPLTAYKYNNRLQKSQFKHMSIDHALLMDSSNQVITFMPKYCATDVNGASINSVPNSCGESFVLDSSVIEKYKSNNDCARVFNKVDQKYNGSRKLAGRSEIFDFEEMKGQSGAELIKGTSSRGYEQRYDRFGSYPTHPDGIGQ